MSITLPEPHEAQRFGVDRLSVSFPVAGFNPDPAAWSSVGVFGPGTDSASERRQGTIAVDGVECMVGVQYIPGTETWWGKVEFNPSRVLDPDGWGVASLAESVGALERVVDQVAGDMCSPKTAGVDELKVKRIDLTRDFVVERSDFYLRGLGPVKRPWARRNLVHYDPNRNGAQTLMVGSGAGVVRLYDKYAETEGRAALGSLRWEAECRSGWAQNYGGVLSVADLRDGDKVTMLAKNRWEWSAMGVEVAARSRVIEQLQRSGLTPAKQRSFLGWLVMQAEGITSPLSNDTASEFSRLARQLGVTLATEVTDDSACPGFVGRLDWDTGGEILRVA